MLANVQQTTIRPIIEGVVAPGSCIHTDEYSIYARLTAWGYEHRTVCHGRGEYARDEDGDGFCEVHVILWKGSGHCCAPGCARTAAVPRRSCPSIWASFNSSTIPASAAKPCSVPSLPPWSHDQTSITPEPRKSLH